VGALHPAHQKPTRAKRDQTPSTTASKNKKGEKELPPPGSLSARSPQRDRNLNKPTETQTMKTLIATALVLSAGITQAASFDYEKQIGAPELFSTLATDGFVSNSVGNDREFAYQVNVGTPELFPTLGITDTRAESVSGERTVFEYQLNIGSSELDPSLS
jgi:hypothetical protein